MAIIPFPKSDSEPLRFSKTFKLPDEHGITVTFAMSSLIALFFKGDEVLQLITQLALWLMLMSLHNKSQLSSLSIGFALLASIHNQTLAVWILLAGAGMFLATSLQAEGLRLWRELVGTIGAALTPLIAAQLINQETQFFLSATTTLTAAVILSTASIHFVVWRLSRKNTELLTFSWEIIFSILIWTALALSRPSLAALTLVPFIIQFFWLAGNYKPSFKKLGQIESLCIAWTTLMIIMLRPA